LVLRVSVPSDRLASRSAASPVLIHAAEAQLTPPLGAVLRPYRRLRRQRAQGDYLASEGAISPD
jgi:hypothetical protein